MRTIPFRRALTVLVALLTVAVFASACSSSKKTGGGSGSSSAPTTSSNTVHVKNFAFNPESLTVPVGTKVTWVFDDSANHTVTASDGSFKSGNLSSGGTYAFTFNKAGTYSYICSIHQYMHATVTVH